MTQEDKAKAYDELIKDIKRIIFNHEGGKLYNLLEKQNELPNSAYTSNKSITEFANNYSHMIWEKLMDKFNKIENYSIGCNDVSDIVLNAIINTYNWLKKQDEEKPIDKIKLKPQGKSALETINEEKVDNTNIVDTNKIKPKFENGSWVINTQNKSVCQIIGCENNTYRIRTYDCTYYQLIKVVDERYRLWTITDAKDGDIIVTGNGNIFIFKGIQDCVVYDYCGLYYGKININASHVNESCATEFPTDYTPAAKEQRDLLMKTLNDAGYTFDFDKKEIKSINKDKPIFKIGDWIVRNNSNVVLFIKSKVGDYLTLETIDGNIYTPCLAPSENKYHLWSIYDAKPGDVIKTDNYNFMFFGIKKDIVQGLNIFIREKIAEWGDPNKDKYTPATKKESDAFKKKMVDAGYSYENLIFKLFK